MRCQIRRNKVDDTNVCRCGGKCAQEANAQNRNGDGPAPERGIHRHGRRVLAAVAAALILLGTGCEANRFLSGDTLRAFLEDGAESLKERIAECEEEPSDVVQTAETALAENASAEDELPDVGTDLEETKAEKRLSQVIAYSSYGSTTTFTYNSLGQLSLEMVYYESYQEEYSYEYDSEGRLICKLLDTAYYDGARQLERQYDAEGRLIAEGSYRIGDYWYDIEYTYDENGRVKTESWSSEWAGSFEYVHSYAEDASGAMIDSRTGTYIYDGVEREEAEVTFLYDEDGRLLRGYDEYWCEPVEYEYYDAVGYTVYSETKEIASNPIYTEADAWQFETEESSSLLYLDILDACGAVIETVYLGDSDAELTYDDDGYLVRVDSDSGVVELIYSDVGEGDAADEALAADAYETLVTDAYAEEYTYSSVTYSYYIPQINLNGEAVEQINAEIYADLYDRIQTAVYELDAYGWTTISEGISYRWFVNGDILSLVILDFCSPDFGGSSDYLVYNLSVSDGTRISDAEVIEAAGYTDAQFYEAAAAALEEAYLTSDINASAVEQLGRGNDMIREQIEMMTAEDNIDDSKPYLGEDGQLCMAARCYSMAGSGQFWTDVCVGN